MRMFGLGEPLSAKTLARDGVLLAGALALVALAWAPPGIRDGILTQRRTAVEEFLSDRLHILAPSASR